MRISSVKRPLNRTTARNSFLINQFGTPGLGSLMARRWVAGTGQLILAVIGFGFVVVWFFLVMSQTLKQIESEGPTRSFAWVGEIGALLFAASWLWALVTSLSLIRQARAQESIPQPPPKL